MAANPGFRKIVGLEIVRSDEEGATVTLDAGEEHLNAHGTVHGGALATLADAAMGTAVAGDGSNPVTIEMKVTYLDPAPAGRLTANAVIRRRGSRITIVETDIADSDERFVAHAIATFTTMS